MDLTLLRGHARLWLADAAVAVFSAGAFAVFQAREGGPFTPWIVATIALQTLPLAVRRRIPWLTLIAVTAGLVLYRHVEAELSLGPVFQAIALYTVGRHARQPWSRAAPVIAAVGMLAPEYLGGRRGEPTRIDLVLLDAIIVVALYTAVWMLGSSQRRIRADADRLRRLADQLRAEKEVSAQHAAAAERARIARDLHDIVAHHVSAIAVQARATAEIVTEDPRLASDGVQRIGATADAALEEMRRLVGLLATDGSDADGAEPSLAHLDRLTDAVEAAGSRVEVRADQACGAAPAAVQVSAYRILQEALTNVLKHAGPTEIRIALCRVPSGLAVDVENGASPGGHRPVAGSGLGLVGMRERVAVFGGTLHAGPTPAGGWRVDATLPFEESR